MTDTKIRIIDAALDLFSERGYEAVSVDDIAKAVGIKAPSLYKHYKSKADIFNSLFEKMTESYNKHSASNNYIDESYPDSIETLIKDVQNQLHYSTTDPFISKARKLLTIEQYRLKSAKEIQTRRLFEDHLNHDIIIINNLVKRGILRAGDTTSMAMQFGAPVSFLTYECERNNSFEPEAFKLVENHIRQFYEVYKA